MNEYTERAILELDSKLELITYKTESPLQLAEESINIVLSVLNELRGIMKTTDFLNESAEIHFFKVLKPNILSRLIYYNAIYKIESKKPHKSINKTEKYLKEELLKIKLFFQDNHEFYKYHITNSTYLDHKYFVRQRHDIKLILDAFYFESDQAFSTSHDYKLAEILSNELIRDYLEGQLLFFVSSAFIPPRLSLKWTANKTALIELIYALNAQSVFNNGNGDIKLIAKYFEHAFNIDLGDFYHTFLEIKSRKINRTKFIDSLRESLIKKMDEQD